MALCVCVCMCLSGEGESMGRVKECVPSSPGLSRSGGGKSAALEGGGGREGGGAELVARVFSFILRSHGTYSPPPRRPDLQACLAACTPAPGKPRGSLTAALMLLRSFKEALKQHPHPHPHPDVSAPPPPRSNANFASKLGEGNACGEARGGGGAAPSRGAGRLLEGGQAAREARLGGEVPSQLRFSPARGRDVAGKVSSVLYPPGPKEHRPEAPRTRPVKFVAARRKTNDLGRKERRPSSPMH